MLARGAGTKTLAPLLAVLVRLGVESFKAFYKLHHAGRVNSGARLRDRDVGVEV